MRRSRIPHIRGSHHINVQYESAPDHAECFPSHDRLLGMAANMFHARKEYVENRIHQRHQEDQDLEHLKRNTGAWDRFWHQSLKLTGTTLQLSRLFNKYRLNKIEKEILLVLILERVALLDCNVNPMTIIEVLAYDITKTMKILRYLSEEGKLFRSGLIFYADPDEDIKERELLIDAALIDAIIFDAQTDALGFPVTRETELYAYIAQFITIARKSSEEFHSSFIQGFGNQKDYVRFKTRLKRFLRELEKTIDIHSTWRIAQTLNRLTDNFAQAIVLSLIGKEMGYLNADNDLFHGSGLACIYADNLNQYQKNLQSLGPDGFLVRQKIVQPCGGVDYLISGNPDELKETEFELTEQTIEELGIEKKTIKKRNNHFDIRTANTRLDQLVLAAKTIEKLDMAFCQIQDAETLFSTWGLGRNMPYGRGVVMLFSGPPGTGKTATAEAVASNLHKPILVADYSKIQNCFVGQTEKNIVRTFREAKANDAVLFWDEADAMFFDRDQAARNWEVRDVNVLLQEIEHFEGVCILATNRKVTLDKALERRITMKIEFPKPDRTTRLQIWKKLVPADLPLDKTINFEDLARAELTGGEIKNVILNAARKALMNNKKGPVTCEDFKIAITMELEGRLQLTASSAPIGFR